MHECYKVSPRTLDLNYFFGIPYKKGYLNECVEGMRLELSGSVGWIFKF
jgi:hypothetical protein